MFKYFEQLINPYPPEHPTQPPKGIYTFCRHYIRGIEPYLIVMALLTATTAVAEALLFGVLGQLVDWLALKDPAGFLEQEWKTLLGLSIFILILYTNHSYVALISDSPNFNGKFSNDGALDVASLSFEPELRFFFKTNLVDELQLRSCKRLLQCENQ